MEFGYFKTLIGSKDMFPQSTTIFKKPLYQFFIFQTASLGDSKPLTGTPELIQTLSVMNERVL